MIDFLNAYIVFIVITGSASVAHGLGLFPKIAVMSAHSLSTALLCTPFSFPGVVVFWALFRRGRQAGPELDYIRQQSAQNIDRIEYAYPAPLGRIVARIGIWCDKVDVKYRRPAQELLIALIVTGPVCGISLILDPVFNFLVSSQ